MVYDTQKDSKMNHDFCRNSNEVCTIPACVHGESLGGKPYGREIARLSKEIPYASGEVTLGELADAIESGHTYTSGVFRTISGQVGRTNEHWHRSQLIVIDVDNKVGEVMTAEEAISRADMYDIPPNLVHTTFSDPGDHTRFRMIWVLPEQIREKKKHAIIMEQLRVLFPMDENAKDVARMYYGGPKIIHYNEDPRLNVFNLIAAACTKIKDGSTSGNANRNIKKHCARCGIAVKKGLPDIELISAGADQLTFCPENLYIYYRTSARNVNKSAPGADTLVVRLDTGTKERSSPRNQTDNYTEKKVSENTLRSGCKLLDEFLDGKTYLEHDEKFMLASNLVNFRNGKSLFFAGLDAYPGYPYFKYTKWQMSWKYIKPGMPKSCYLTCRYHVECPHQQNILLTVTRSRDFVRILEHRKKLDIEMAEKALSRYWENVAYDHSLHFPGELVDDSVDVVFTPTGLGKTEQYVGDKNLNDAIIYVPTHQLKEEVAERARAKGVQLVPTPPLPNLDPETTGILEKYYSMGCNMAAAIHLQRLAEEGNVECQNYLKDLELARRSRYNAVTTHARMQYFANDRRKLHIIDEDPLQTLLPIDFVYISELSELYLRLTGDQRALLGNILDRIDKLAFGQSMKRDWHNLGKMEVLENAVSKQPFRSNVMGFLNCDYAIKERSPNGGIIRFIRQTSIQSDHKWIILTATGSKIIFERLFPKVRFVDLDDVKQTGKIIQYPRLSFSRDSLKKNPEHLQIAQGIAGSRPVITYKTFSNKFKNTVGHFGNIRGLDSLAGEDIVVIGTPHIRPTVYILYALALGERPVLSDSKMSLQMVTHNGYEFYFNTYCDDNPFLQHLQLSLIGSELIQAVGRARILRKDATVRVLSRYPVPGAEFVYDLDQMK